MSEMVNYQVAQSIATQVTCCLPNSQLPLPAPPSPCAAILLFALSYLPILRLLLSEFFHPSASSTNLNNDTTQLEPHSLKVSLDQIAGIEIAQCHRSSRSSLFVCDIVLHLTRISFQVGFGMDPRCDAGRSNPTASNRRMIAR